MLSSSPARDRLIESDEPVSVAFVSNSARGEYTGRLGWIPTLRGHRFDVTFVLPHGEDEYAERMARQGVRVLRYQLDRKSLLPTDDARTVAELLSILRKERFSIVHTFGHKANIYGALAAAAARVPTTFTHVTGLGSTFTPGGGPHQVVARSVLRALYRIVARLSDGVFFQNQDDLDVFSFLPEKKRILIGGTGVDTVFFSPDAVSVEAAEALRRELRLLESSVVVTFIGRLLADKGINELLLAARTLSARDPRLVFLMVGTLDPGNARSLHETDIQGHEGSQIRFLGRRDDIREILAITDVFVNPSYREGVPRTNLEALAMAKAIVTTDAPGCRETVADGENGLLVPPGSSAALEQALQRLLGSPEMRVRLGQAGRLRAETRYSIPECVGRVETAYRRAIQGRNGRAAPHAMERSS